MRVKTWLCVAVLLFGASVAQAQSFVINEFTEGLDGNAPDAYEPTIRNQLVDPSLGGVPPVDWNDIRNGWDGVIEENMSPAGDIGYPGPDPGAFTPEYGVITPNSGQGPYWSPSSFDNDCTELCFNIDQYADTLIAPNTNGVPDYWWTNAVGDASSAYITESGITGTWDASGTTITYSTTSGVPIASVPLGAWYETEVCFSYGADGDLDAVHNVWDATHTVLYGSVTLTSLFLTPVNQPMTANYSWFTFFEGNVDALFVDNFKVECVPEPGTLALAGMGALGLVFVARRRRQVA